MMAGSHVALGVAAWLSLAPYLGHADVSPLPLGLAVVGSLLPDIDHPKSWAGKRMRPLSTAWAGALGHRGVTHSVFAVAVCYWLLLRHGLPTALTAPLAVGYFSHLGADLLTPGGPATNGTLQGHLVPAPLPDRLEGEPVLVTMELA